MDPALLQAALQGVDVPRILHGCGGGVGLSCSSDWTPRLGTSICCRWGVKRKKKKNSSRSIEKFSSSQMLCGHTAMKRCGGWGGVGNRGETASGTSPAKAHPSCRPIPGLSQRALSKRTQLPRLLLKAPKSATKASFSLC